MGRPFWSCLAATIVAVAAALPSSAVADDHARRHYNSGDDERDNLGWVIVSGGITSVSDMSDLESLEEFRHRFGSRFLYLRDGDDHYVIRDEEMIDRAQRAARSIKIHGKEMGMLARFELQGTRGSRKNARKIAAMRQFPAPRGEVGGSSPRDKANERLDREFVELVEQMDALRTNPHQDDAPTATSRDLKRRSDDLSKRLEKAVRDGHEELREILVDAKARDLAKQVD